MKKLVLALSIFFAFTANAQQGRKEGFRNEKQEFHQQNDKGFSGLRLTAKQERKISDLSRERLSAREYDARIRRILSKEQYVQYQRHGFDKDKKVAMSKPFRR
ncbi:hypothetical protein VUJ46_14815 [Chryseobacterium sp. MYb264]|uniref:hypothetical protein n=1 Tax=Chryseobacterium sp. MYb264 TaxID=2745153 RepID=UPI002E10D9BB|nr:hypothetical protein VUJ46_14815 [Chryseobacterium sp. MYb264]